MKIKFRFDDVSRPNYLSESDLKKELRYEYAIKVAKLYSAILGKKVSDYYDFSMRDRIFDKDSSVFRVNLYPISFHHDNDDLWEGWLYRKTGLPTKSLYRAWWTGVRGKVTGLYL